MSRLYFPPISESPSEELLSGNKTGSLGFDHTGITVPDVALTPGRLLQFGGKVIKPLGTATDPVLEHNHPEFPDRHPRFEENCFCYRS